MKDAQFRLPNILLIETQVERGLSLEALLAPCSFNVMRTDSSATALDVLSRRDFSAILISHELPTLDGLELATRIHQQHQPKTLAILLISSHDFSDEEIERGLQVGVRDFILRSAPPSLIRSKVSILVGMNADQKRLRDLVCDPTEELRFQEERDLFFDLSLDLLCIATATGYFKRVNSAFESILGFSKTELLSKPCLEFVHPDDRKATAAVLEEVVNGEPFSYFENRYRCSDGSYKWLAWSGQASGSRIFAVARDITDRKRDQLELEVSESRYRKLFEELPLSVQVLSPDGRTIRVNRAWMKLWGIQQEAIDNYILNGYEILQDQQLVSKGVMPYLKKGLSGEATSIPAILYETAEQEPLRTGTRARWVEGYIYPIKNGDGTIREVVIMHHDITERTQSERTLKLLSEAGELLGASLDHRTTLQHVADLAAKRLGDCCIVHLLDKQGELTKVAAACGDPSKLIPLEELCDLVSRLPDPLFGPRFVQKFGQPKFVRCITPDFRLPDEIEGGDQLKDVKDFGITSMITVPMKIENRLIGTVSVQALGRFYNEQDLALAQELATRAALAIQNSNLYTEAQRAIHLRDEFLAVASHELKTPLTSLSLQIQSLQRILGERKSGTHAPEKLIQMLKISGKQLHDLSEFIDGLLDFSRFSDSHFSLRLTKFDLSQMAQEIVSRFSNLPENAGRTIAVESTASVVGHWDRFRIEQVITNLLTNAVKYGSERPVHVRVWAESGQARLSVQDFGIGITQENQERIFNRFERAVPGTHFRGIGLGLYITKEIITLHGGFISVQSDLGKGSVFTVTLPLTVPT